MPALNSVCGWRMSSNKFHTTSVTVATSRNSFPELGRLGTNFDKVAAISNIIATNQNKIATHASPKAYDQTQNVVICFQNF